MAGTGDDPVTGASAAAVISLPSPREAPLTRRTEEGAEEGAAAVRFPFRGRF